MPDAARRSRKRRLAVAVAALGGAVVASAGGEQTYAAFSDFQIVAGNTIGAGVWGTDLPLIPEQCRAHGFVPVNWFVINDFGLFWSDGVAPLEPLGPGKPGSTQGGAFHGTNEADFIVNQGSTRTLHAWGGDDCVVAGPAGDIVHGGEGNDVLIGGKKQFKGEVLYDATALEAVAALEDDPVASSETDDESSYLDGESGVDVCAPGLSDVVVNCEAVGGEMGPVEVAAEPSGPIDITEPPEDDSEIEVPVPLDEDPVDPLEPDEAATE
jgi:Ca2+-binding RTX toxin-like protein